MKFYVFFKLWLLTKINLSICTGICFFEQNTIFMPESFRRRENWDNFEIHFCTFYIQNAAYIIPKFNWVPFFKEKNVTRHCPKLAKPIVVLLWISGYLNKLRLLWNIMVQKVCWVIRQKKVRTDYCWIFFFTIYLGAFF